jgi:hypothetical protein
MIGNQLEFGDFLYSGNQNDVWNIQMEGINDKVDSVKLIERVVFFPMSLLILAYFRQQRAKKNYLNK